MELLIMTTREGQSDIVDAETRSRIMSRIRGKDTTPELALRRALWTLGIRYRVHDRSVIGTPDLSHKAARVAVFVDGCFWHGCPAHYTAPKTSEAFWRSKLEANILRRQAVKKELKASDWHVFELWECQVKKAPERYALRVAEDIKARRIP